MKRSTGVKPEDFWSRVRKSDGCWEWQGSIIGNGYGVVRVDRKQVYAHRYAYELTHGTIPAGRLICHHCDNPRCVRPDHIYAGTHADNMRDALERGRHGYKTHPGEESGNAVLTDDQVIEARLSSEPATWLARRWGVSETAVEQARRKGWTHLPVAGRRPDYAEIRRLVGVKVRENRATTCRRGHERSAHTVYKPNGQIYYCRPCHAAGEAARKQRVAA